MRVDLDFANTNVKSEFSLAFPIFTADLPIACGGGAQRVVYEPIGFGCVLFGGTDGNRTRVQRPLIITFSVGSLSFTIPEIRRRKTGFFFGSPFMLDRYRDNSRYKFTTDLTHGESRSPLPRYGRHYCRITAYAARATLVLSFII